MKHSDLNLFKERGEKIACLTAYDSSIAKLIDDCGVDVVLIGDSLGMVIQGTRIHAQLLCRICYITLRLWQIPANKHS